MKVNIRSRKHHWTEKKLPAYAKVETDDIFSYLYTSCHLQRLASPLRRKINTRRGREGWTRSWVAFSKLGPFHTNDEGCERKGWTRTPVHTFSTVAHTHTNEEIHSVRVRDGAGLINCLLNSWPYPYEWRNIHIVGKREMGGGWVPACSRQRSVREHPAWVSPGQTAWPTLLVKEYAKLIRNPKSSWPPDSTNNDRMIHSLVSESPPPPLLYEGPSQERRSKKRKLWLFSHTNTNVLANYFNMKRN